VQQEARGLEDPALAQALQAARKKGPGRVRLLTRQETGTTGAAQRALLAALGAPLPTARGASSTST
jgi:hypothetical protein